MKRKKQKPPFFANLLAKFILPKNDNSYLSGDFKEIYFHILETEGRFTAWRWYWWQIISSIPHFIFDYWFWRFTMFRNYFKVTLRNIKRYKSYSVINIIGLAVGLASCILILLWVKDELSFDKFHKNSKQIFRLINEVHNSEKTIKEAGTPVALAPALKNEFPEIVDYTRFLHVDRRLVNYQDKNFTENRFAYVDPSLLKIFSFSLIQGNPQTAFINPFSIIITEEMSQKYFGETNPLGKILCVENRDDMTVTGIIKFPQHSHLQYDFLCPFSYLEKTGFPLNNWSWTGYHTYLLLNTKADPQVVSQKISNILNKHNTNTKSKLKLQPLLKTHLYSSDITFDNLNSQKGNIVYIKIFIPLALFILALACINFMNLTTARSSNRAKEIGLRKVVGANKHNIISQFFGESILLSAISLFLGIFLVLLFLPIFNTISGKQISFEIIQNYKVISGIILLTLVTGFIAGSYPAFFLSTFQPVKVLKGKFNFTNKGVAIRKTLVVIQFSITILLLIGTIVVSNQLTFIKNKDLGYNKDQLIYIKGPRNFRQNFEPLKNRLLQSTDITHVSNSMVLPTAIGSWVTDNVSWQGKSPNVKISVDPIYVGYDFFETFNMEIINGRSFSKEFSNEMTQSYILNEEAVKTSGIDSPIGKQFSLDGNDGIIIGVVKNFHHNSLHHKIDPLVFKLNPTNFYIWIKIKPQNVSQTLDYIKNSWSNLKTGHPFEFNFLDTAINNLYQDEKRLSKLFNCFTGLAIIISCLGLFGMSAFIAEQRIKEIGIRKVLGATVTEIMFFMSKGFIKGILIANIIAWPVAYFVMNGWLQNFAYRVNLGYFTFLISGLIALIIALLTLSFQILKAANINPVNSLKYE